MAKILSASVQNGKVLVGDVEVPGAIFLSAGTKNSTGIILLDKDMGALYIASSFSDLSTLIEKMVEIVDQVKTIATGIDGATNAPGAQAPAIAQLAVMSMELNQLKETLA